MLIGVGALLVIFPWLEPERKGDEMDKQFDPRCLTQQQMDILNSIQPFQRPKYTEVQVLKAVYESGLHQYAKGVIFARWKDGIDIDEPSLALMNFVRKLTENA